MNKLKTVNCEQLMTTPLKTIEFCVDGMISTRLFILAGAPKVGKSRLALGMALSIAEGKNFVGTATELAALLAPRFETEIFPNRLTRDLVQNAYELAEYGIKFSSERSHVAIRIRLELLQGDGSDSKNPAP